MSTFGIEYDNLQPLLLFQIIKFIFKLKTRHFSIVQRSSSVVNSYSSSDGLIQAVAYKFKRNRIRNFEKLTYNLNCASHKMTPARALHLIQKEDYYNK